MAKWTKKDTKSVIGAMEGWWCYWKLYAKVSREEIVSRLTIEQRREIVALHFKNFAAMLADRAANNAASAEHFRVTRVYGDHTDEMVERFTKLAAETRKASQAAQKLSDRVAGGDHPPELESFT